MSRRLLAASLLLVIAVGAPAAAWAAFTTKASGSTRVGTLKLVAPADAWGNFYCPGQSSSLPRGGAILTSWDPVTGADAYTLTLDVPNGATDVVRTVTSSSRQNLTPTTTPKSGTWRISIVAKAGTWTGPAWTQTFTC